MEKLIELLNEFELTVNNRDNVKRIYDEKWFRVKCGDSRLIEHNEVDSTIMLISKKYQFIERLITKGKVDNKKLIDLTAKDDCVVIMRFEEDSQKVKVLLLMLAISDNPLDDLISVLKDDGSN